jgi:two-component system sensor histidine kinase AlgZ
LNSVALKSRLLRFWPLQTLGWGFYMGINILCSLPWWRRVDYDAFRGGFLLSALVSSFLMYGLCHVLWKHHVRIVTACLVCIVAAFPLGAFCSGCAIAVATHYSRVRPPFHWVDVIVSTPSGWFLLVAWVAFYFGIKHYLALEEKHHQLIATEILARESQLLAKEAQLLALRYQLQPHFLFNTMNAISALVLDRPYVAKQMIGKLGILLRSTLDVPDLHYVPLSDELAVTEEYLAIEAIRFEDRLAVRWDVDPEVANALVPRLILQPLVENAMRHGIARRKNGGFILIKTQRMGATLAVTVENEPPEEFAAVLFDGIPRTGGLGLENVRKRLEHMYGAEGTMHTTTNARGNYEVTFTLPIDNRFAPGNDAMETRVGVGTPVGI